MTYELTEHEQSLLTGGKVKKWQLEIYEYAFDARVRQIVRYKALIDFLGIAMAIVFLLLQYVFKNPADNAIHDSISLAGTVLSLLIIVVAIWGLVNRWTDECDRKRMLSQKARELLTRYESISRSRPVDTVRLSDWEGDVAVFEVDRKHELATVGGSLMRQGFRHIGALYGDQGVVCGMCGRQWQKGERSARKKWLAWQRCCSSCGVTYE